MKTIEITQSKQTNQAHIKANNGEKFLTLEAIQNAQKQIAPDGIKVAYTDLFFNQELVKTIIAHNEANPKSPIMILFGDNDEDKAIVQNLANNPNAMRKGTGNQAKAFEDMLASEYSKAAIGIVTVKKIENPNSILLKDLFTESLVEVTAFAQNNPYTTFIVPATFKGNNATINIGTGMAANKLAGNGVAVEKILGAISVTLDNILNGINQVPTVDILTQGEVEAHRGVYNLRYTDYDSFISGNSVSIYNDPVREKNNFLNVETVIEAIRQGKKVIYAEPFYDQNFIKALITYNNQHPEAPVLCLYGEEDIRKEKSNANSKEERGGANGQSGALGGFTYAEANKVSFGITTAKKSDQNIEKALAWFSSFAAAPKAEKSIKELVAADLEALINLAKAKPGAKFIVPIAPDDKTKKLEISIGKGTAAKNLGNLEDQAFVYDKIQSVINEIEAMSSSGNNGHIEVTGDVVHHDHN